ncbi:MAG: amidohydrolase family protein [Candidatus Eisenbacteria bacterium]|nr:amidohydrolase family protein [Candidatus Eisenbacteria bacterium]
MRTLRPFLAIPASCALVLALVLALSALYGAPAAAPPDPQAGLQAQETILRQARIFDVHTGSMSSPCDLLIDHETIAEILPANSERTAQRQIDCSDCYIVPGLFDCHTHLAHASKAGADSLKRALGDFAHAGVLYVRDVGGPIGTMQEMAARTASNEWTGPEIFYSGPMLEGSPLTWASFNEEMPGFTVPIDTPSRVDSLLPALAARGARMVKTFNHIDPALYRHLVEVARRNSLEIVHDPGTPIFHWVPMDMALDLGVTSIEHAKAPWPVVLKDDLRSRQDALANAQASPLEQMGVMLAVVEAGWDGIDTLRLNALAAKMVAKNAYLCPTLHVFATMAKMPAGSDADSSQAIPPERLEMMRKVLTAMESVSKGFVQAFARAKVRMLVGQDGCDPYGTRAEMEELEACGVPPAEILRGATIYPAQWLQVDDRVGSIEPGKEASFIVVKANPLEHVGNVDTIVFVMRKGALLP